MPQTYFIILLFVAAVVLVVRRMRRPVRPGHGVVDIGFVGRPVTARPPTGQIPPPNELRGVRRRPISRIRRCAGGHRQRLELRGLGDFAHRLGGQNAEPGQIAQLGTGPVNRGLFGQHMDNGCRSGGAVGRCRAVVATAPASKTGVPTPAARTHQRGAARVCADRARTPWLLTHRGADPARRRRRRECCRRRRPSRPRSARSPHSAARRSSAAPAPRPDRTWPPTDPPDPAASGPTASSTSPHNGRSPIQPGHHLVGDVVGARDDR